MIYVIFTQHSNNPVEISNTGAIKGFSSQLDKAEEILKNILVKENKEDKIEIHGVVIEYMEGALQSPFWTLTEKQKVVKGGICKDGKYQETLEVSIDNLDSRVISDCICS